MKIKGVMHGSVLGLAGLLCSSCINDSHKIESPDPFSVREIGRSDGDYVSRKLGEFLNSKRSHLGLVNINGYEMSLGVAHDVSLLAGLGAGDVKVIRSRRGYITSGDFDRENPKSERALNWVLSYLDSFGENAGDKIIQRSELNSGRKMIYDSWIKEHGRGNGKKNNK